MAKKIVLKDAYLTVPPHTNTKRFHIFNNNRSLCGKYGMLIVNKNDIEPYKGNETYSPDQDCKECFRKAGLLKEEEKVNP
jgi:hypothetical protein